MFGLVIKTAGDGDRLGNRQITTQIVFTRLGYLARGNEERLLEIF